MCCGKICSAASATRANDPHAAIANGLIQTATKEPDLVPCNFRLFPKLKSPLTGKRSQTINEIQENTMGRLMVIPTKDFVECFKQWQRCWENCVRSQGAYIEGDWDIIVLCTIFLASCTFFNKCLCFSYKRIVAGYFLDSFHICVSMQICFYNYLFLKCMKVSWITYATF